MNNCLVLLKPGKEYIVNILRKITKQNKNKEKKIE